MNTRLALATILVAELTCSSAIADVLVDVTALDFPIGNGVQRLQENRPLAHSILLSNGGTSARAAADLRTGILRSEVLTRTVPDILTGDSFGVAVARITDVVTFPSGAAGTAFFDWGFDGSIGIEQIPPNTSRTADAYLGVTITSLFNGQVVTNSRLATATSGNSCSGAASQNCLTGPFLQASVAFRGSVSFPISPGSFSVTFELGAVASRGDDVQFGNTSYIYLRLPQNVNYSSGSGQFLALAQPVPAPVPEPSAPLLFVGGAAWLLAVLRRSGRAPLLASLH